MTAIAPTSKWIFLKNYAFLERLDNSYVKNFFEASNSCTKAKLLQLKLFHIVFSRVILLMKKLSPLLLSVLKSRLLGGFSFLDFQFFH